jgi:hypothetical protein
VNRQPHDADLKAQARSLYAADGPTLAASVTGIPARTIRRWAVAEQWPRSGDGHRPHLHVAPVAETRQPTGKTRVVAIGYGLQRRVLLRRLGELATLALDQVETELRAGHTVKARDGMVVCGIALDKAEQLAKAAGPDLAGDRPDAAEAVARIRAMAADLATRKTGSDGQPQ